MQGSRRSWEGGWTKGTDTLVRWCVCDKRDSKAEIWENPCSVQFLKLFKEKRWVCLKKKNNKIFAGTASLGTSRISFFSLEKVGERVCIQHWQPARRLNEWGRCTTHCQSLTCWDPNTHLGLQHTHWGTNAAPSFRHRGEEGEYLNAWGFLLVFASSPNRSWIQAQLKSAVELIASKPVFYLGHFRLYCDCRVLPTRVTVQCISSL